MQGLDKTKIKPEAKYSNNLTRSRKFFCLNLHYNGSNSFLFVNATKIYQFKAKDSEIKKYPLGLGNISKGFSVSNMKKETGLNGYVEDISVDFRIFGISDITNIHKYLVKIHDIK